MSFRPLLPLALLFTLVLSGCPAAKLYREGQDLYESGKEYKAAQRYLDSLDVNPKFKKAHDALVLVAPDAYAEKLERAVSDENDGNFPGALTEYRELKELLDRIGNYEEVDFPVVNVKKKIDEMENASAEESYREAETQLTAREWEAAILAYKTATSFKRGYKDTEEKIALAFYSWADDEVLSHAYRAGAEHYVEATKSGGVGYKDAQAKSGVIYHALGRYFVKSDRCRQAVRDLRRAGSLLGPESIATDLPAAETCAVTPVAILPLENPTGQTVAGMALGDTIADATAAKVQANASEFVRLMERDALDAVLAEQGLSASGLAGGASKVKGVRYLVLGKLTQVRLVRDTPKATKVTFETREGYDCQKTNKEGKSYTSTCYRDVTLSYADHKATISLDVVGSLRVVDVLTGEQLASPAVQATAKDAIHYGDNFKDAAGNPVAISAKGRTGGIDVDSSYIKLSEARTSLKDEGELANEVVEAIAGQASDATLGVVDVEKKAIDPTTLDLAGKR